MSDVGVWCSCLTRRSLVLWKSNRLEDVVTYEKCPARTLSVLCHHLARYIASFSFQTVKTLLYSTARTALFDCARVIGFSVSYETK